RRSTDYNWRHGRGHRGSRAQRRPAKHFRCSIDKRSRAIAGRNRGARRFGFTQREPWRAHRARNRNVRNPSFVIRHLTMMYYLHRLSDQFIGFNVFFYVTFRAIAAAVTAFLVTLIFGNFVIRKLTALKLGQPIRAAAEVHRLAELHGGKQGTPTMGGVLVIGAVFVSSLIWARPDNRFVWLALFSMVYLGGLGFVDDYLKVTKKHSAGISGRIKLICQLALACIVAAVFLTNPLIEVQARSLYLPFFKIPVVPNMGWFTLIFFAFIVVGSSNAVNLTDGLDGLAAGCTITVAFAYALLSYAAGNYRIAEYLQVPFYPYTGELTVICAALVGAGLGFLWFNCHPAKVIMGDT